MPRDTSKAQLWANRLDRFRRSSLTISQFCRNEKINLQTFNYWRKKLAEDLTATVLSGPPSRSYETSSGGVQFTIEAAGLKIECQSRSLEAINTILAWTMQHQASSFKQLIVRD